MLTPLDIESKVFTKSVSGYNTSEVKAFLREVLTDYEKSYKENIELKDKVNTLQEGIQYYKNIEETLHNTLILAEKMAEDSKALAIQKSEQIEKEAHLKADIIVNDARNEMYRINRANEELIRNFEITKIQMKQYLKAQLELTEETNLEETYRQEPYNSLLDQIKNKDEEEIVPSFEDEAAASDESQQENLYNIPRYID